MLNFLYDERGAGTIMGLLWFILLVGICGLSVDVTNGFRHQTMLQATADSAALAAVIDLPDEGMAKNTAVNYSLINMPSGLYGNILETDRVSIGTWDLPTRTWSNGGTDPNAVHVAVEQSEANGNAVATNFLRIVALLGPEINSFDVNVQAVAVRFVPKCIRDGLVARNIVYMSTQNKFVNGMCIHGNNGVKMQNANEFELGVNVTMPDPDTMLQTPNGGMASNPGLEDALHENILNPWAVDHTNEVMAGILAFDADLLPDYVTATEVTPQDFKYDFSDVVPGSVIHIQCQFNKTVGIPGGTVLEDVVIISDCRINVGADVVMHNVFLGSTSLGAGRNPEEKANIIFSPRVEVGLPDKCKKGGGVQIFTNATVHFSSSAKINGLQIVAAGDIELGALAGGINGISAQAGGDIKMTSKDLFGLCVGNNPDLFTVWYYKLVL